MNTRCRPSLQFTLSVCLSFILSACANAQQFQWSGVERIVALSDPHGAYDAMVDTLKAADIMDDQQQWSGGAAHLVITGDLLDRGPDSRQIMDLVMRLEKEAEAQGGMVHLTLGNHEVMNLVGDLRYVSEAEYAAFAGEETPADRMRWFERFKTARAIAEDVVPDEIDLEAEFDETYPPGFFAHRRAFSSEGQYGKWLLQKPLLVVVNKTAFVHGGLPPLVAELGLVGTNDQLRVQVSDYVRHLETLINAGLIEPSVNFYDQAELAEGIVADLTLDRADQFAAKALIKLNDASVHHSDGPLWYRGTVGCSALSEGGVLANTLDSIGAERVVVGHTPTLGRQILQRLNGRVIEIDTGMLNASYGGSGHALVLQGDQVTVLNQAGGAPLSVMEHPRRVGARNSAITASALEELLANGAIVDSQIDAAERRIVELSDNGMAVHAVFVPAKGRKNINAEIAAYRLDKLLGLDMVPVTVAREIDGERGTLQFLPDDSLDEAERSAAGRGGGAWCPLQRQWNSMYVFDVLVGNQGRAPHSMAYSPQNWQLLLVGHENAFGTRRTRPKHLERIELDLTPTWIEALTSLSDERLAEDLGDVLDKRRISTLGKRRDLLLRDAATP